MTYTVIALASIFLLIFWCCNELIDGWCDDEKGSVAEKDEAENNGPVLMRESLLQSLLCCVSCAYTLDHGKVSHMHADI